MMSLVLMSLAVVAVLSATVAPAIGRRAGWVPVVLGWVGCIGGLAVMYFGQVTELAAAMSIAALAAVAVLPAAIRQQAVRRDAMTIGAAVPLAILAAGLFARLPVEAVATPGGELVSWLLVTAQWAAFAAAMSCLFAASAIVGPGVGGAPGDPSRATRATTAGPSLALVVVGLVAGVALIGNLRASVGGQGYALPLSSASGPAYFAVTGTGAGEQLRLLATHPVEWANLALGALALLVVAAAVTGALRSHRGLGALLWGGAGAGAFATLGGLLQAARQATLPAAGPYFEQLRQVFRGYGLSDTVAQRATFAVEGAVGVAPSALWPEVAALGLAGLVCTIAAVHLALGARGGGGASMRGAARGDGLPAPWLHARDLTLQGVVLGWLAWMLSLLTHDRVFGAAALTTPGEWIALGVLLAATGVLVAGWRPTNRLEGVLAALVPGLAALLFIGAMAASIAFGTTFGSSL